MHSPRQKLKAAELQKLMDKEGKGEKLEAWDWWYYTEKLRKEKYNLEEEEIKPALFKAKTVREGAFAVANKLYGITLTKSRGYPRLSSRCGSVRSESRRWLTTGHFLCRITSPAPARVAEHG